jgi:hypothetical protein
MRLYLLHCALLQMLFVSTTTTFTQGFHFIISNSGICYSNGCNYFATGIGTH